ncbi:MAG TPA: DoxX family protein [Stellaceae bacterium]|nr:DoxX family protein [Stellaceae bacterium]
MTDVTAEPKLYIPGLAGLWQSLAPYGYPIMRFAAGAILIEHGWVKLVDGTAPGLAEHLLGPMGFPFPIVWAYFLGLLESVGCLCLAVGLFTRPIAAMLVVELFIITFAVHFRNGYSFSAPHGGYEYPLLLTALYLGILFRGSDRCSIDRLIGRQF